MKHTPQKNTKFWLDQDPNAPQSPLFAYVLDRQGELLQQKRIDGKGNFEIPELQPHGTRLFIAPELPDKKVPTLQDLIEMEAYEPLIPKRLPKDGIRKLLPIPEILWPKWVWCFCRVRGRVVREFCLPFPLNFCFQLPVCPARVHVCRVKRRIIWEVADLEILKIRDFLLYEIPKIGPPIPEPEPFAVRQGLQINVGQASRSAAKAEAVQETRVAEIFSQPLALKLQTASVPQLRRALDEHFYELRPYFPYLNLCGLLYRSEELFVVDADHDGRFDRTFFHPCNEDNDLYFWVEYLIAGQWVTVYRPSLCSGTYWNFVCGSSVTLKITDPRVTGCRPITGRFMEVNRIGSSAWLPRIDNNSGLVHDLAFGDDTTNAAGNPVAATTYERPFAGTLAILGGFGSNLPDPLQATHFRVSYKALGAADWTVLNNPLYRGYSDDIEVGGLTKRYDKQFLLNETAQPEFYKIPKNEASDQTEIAAPAAPATLIDREWASNEFTLAVIDTNSLNEADTYDIRIELCKTVGGVLQPVAVRRELLQIPDPNDYTQNVVADNDHIYPAVAVTDALGLRIRVRVDRRMTTGSIDDAQVDGVSADPQCGLLNYAAGSTARLGLRAAHPDNRATFGFGVVRGNNQPVFDTDGESGSNTNTNGLVDAVSTVNGYVRSGDNFAKNNFSVAEMLTVPGVAPAANTQCAGAAFAETLHVRAMATDGTHRLSQFDSYAVAAFAIIEDCHCDE